MFKEILSKIRKGSDGKRVENLDAETFAQKLKEDKNGILIDVRTKSEHQMARIPNSELIDIYDPTFINQINNLDRSKNYYLYCRSGNRSLIAGNKMLKMGFNNVYNLRPGIIGWKREKVSQIQ